MVSTEQELAGLLLSIARGENQVEQARQSLAGCEDFEVLSVFKVFDKSAVGTISVKEISEFIGECSQRAVGLLIKQYDANWDGRLSLNEFSQLVLPHTNDLLRESITVKSPVEGMSEQVSFVLKNLLVLEIRVQEGLESSKQEMACRENFNLLNSFRKIDCEVHGFIDKEAVRAFLRSSGHPIGPTDCDAIFRRIAASNSEYVTFDEFAEAVLPNDQDARAKLPSSCFKANVNDFQPKVKRQTASLLNTPMKHSRAETWVARKITSPLNSRIHNSIYSPFRSLEASLRKPENPIRASDLYKNIENPYQPGFEGSYIHLENSYGHLENSYKHLENSYGHLENSYKHLENSYGHLENAYRHVGNSLNNLESTHNYPDTLHKDEYNNFEYPQSGFESPLKKYETPYHSIISPLHEPVKLENTLVDESTKRFDREHMFNPNESMRNPLESVNFRSNTMVNSPYKSSFKSVQQSPQRTSKYFRPERTADILISFGTPKQTLLSHEIASELKNHISIKLELEESKKTLSVQPDFSLGDCFRMFDRNQKGFLLSIDIQDVLISLGIQFNIDEVYFLITSYSFQQDGRLQYSDFSAMVAPDDRNYAKNLINKETYDASLSQTTLQLLQRTLELLIDAERHSQAVRHLISKRQMANIMDTVRTGGDISDALKSNGFFLSDSEINSLQIY